MKHAILATLATLALSGCAGWDQYRAAGLDGLAKLNDRLRVDSELVLCRGISVGAWRRAYGSDAARAAAWRALCADPGPELPSNP